MVRNEYLSCGAMDVEEMVSVRSCLDFCFSKRCF